VNRFSYAAVAAVLVVVIGGGTYLLASNHPSSGGASPSPATAAATAQATTLIAPSPSLATAAVAQAMWGDWVADVQLGLRNQGPRIQLSVSWGDGLEAWLLTGYSNGVQVFDSDASGPVDGQLRLVAKVTADGCTAGDVGTYAWTRSADGTFMTLRAVAEACAARSTALARTWVHTLSAVTDGGQGVLPADDLELTLPARKFGLAAEANGIWDRTWDGVPYIEFLAIRNPTPFKAPCGTTLATDPALTTATGLVTYVKNVPGFRFTSAAGIIDGHPATHLTGTPRAGYTCASGSVGVFWGNQGDGGDNWTVAPGNTQPLSVWITQNGADAWIFSYSGDQIAPADQAQVVASIRFISKLPTP
jgi:hypothetical protein